MKKAAGIEWSTQTDIESLNKEFVEIGINTEPPEESTKDGKNDGDEEHDSDRVKRLSDELSKLKESEMWIQESLKR